MLALWFLSFILSCILKPNGKIERKVIIGSSKSVFPLKKKKANVIKKSQKNIESLL